MTRLGSEHVELGMYPFRSFDEAWDEIWAAVRRRAPWLPAELTRSGDVHARWADPDCLVTQMCGWPFAAQHRDDWRLIGSVSLDLDEADGDGHYRSVLLTPHEADLEGVLRGSASGAPTRVVANSVDSLSGWISLLAATEPVRGDAPVSTSFTDAHVDSLRALQRGDADLACIDSWSLALISVDDPDLVAGLHRIGEGPRIPTPPFVARAAIGPERIETLRAGFSGAMTDRATAAARRALRIGAPAANTMADYDATLDLAPVAG